MSWFSSGFLLVSWPETLVFVLFLKGVTIANFSRDGLQLVFR